MWCVKQSVTLWVCLIANAIGKFEAIAEEIENGIAANSSKIAINRQSIDVLLAQNKNLSSDAERGSSVAAKLRQLIA